MTMYNTGWTAASRQCLVLTPPKLVGRVLVVVIKLERHEVTARQRQSQRYRTK